MYTNETIFYKLPQYAPDDAMDPVADFNPAFVIIDKALKLTGDKATAAFDKAGFVVSVASSAEADALRARNAALAASAYAKNAQEGVASLRASVRSIDDRVSNNETAIVHLTAEITKATNAAKEASVSAANAEKSANLAHIAATHAEASAAVATKDAAQAVTTANAATATATQALNTANNALGDVQEAVTNSQEAVTKANQANIKAESAIDIANSAEDAANNAVTKADEAAQAAEDARTSAQSAVTSASAANASAAEAAEAARRAEESAGGVAGDIATINGDIASLRSSVATVTQLAKNNHVSVQDLYNKQNAIKAEIAAVNTLANQADEKAVNALEKIEEIKQNIGSADNSLSELTIRVTDNESTISQLESGLETANSNIAANDVKAQGYANAAKADAITALNAKAQEINQAMAAGYATKNDVLIVDNRAKALANTVNSTTVGNQALYGYLTRTRVYSSYLITPPGGAGNPSIEYVLNREFSSAVIPETVNCLFLKITPRYNSVDGVSQLIAAPVRGVYSSNIMSLYMPIVTPPNLTVIFCTAQFTITYNNTSLVHTLSLSLSNMYILDPQVGSSTVFRVDVFA